jgi:hypothetical protein
MSAERFSLDANILFYAMDVDAEGAVFGTITVRHPFDGERLSPIIEGLLAN